MQLHLRVMGVQLALLLAVPLLGLGIGSPQNWGMPQGRGGFSYRMGMVGGRGGRGMGGLPRSGAGYSWNFPGGMNRGYQQGQSWQRMDGLTRSGASNSMGSPRYADYSRAGQDRYGGIGLSDLVCLLI